MVPHLGGQDPNAQYGVFRVPCPPPLLGDDSEGGLPFLGALVRYSKGPNIMLLSIRVSKMVVYACTVVN